MITAIALSLQSGFKLAKQNKKAIIDTKLIPEKMER
jgi:hypothetical protein